MSEALFEQLAQTDPQRLLNLIRSGTLPNYELTFAAEHAGSIAGDFDVCGVLLPLLDHESPVVREGAMYGLASHPNDEVIARIRAVADSDPIEEVRRAAHGVLEGLAE